MVIALLVLIVLILLLGPDTILNLFIWLVIAALLLGLILVIIALYQAYPKEVAVCGVFGVIGCIVLWAWIRQQEQQARKRWEE